ncbi:hypothetical protein SAMN05216215_10873 [Saccharopolyspora shandongensis]|uniref:Uncharacterized protein n=1 Tax=Saccharopolyspora shandongensis TaxID=418495 RepID=A0A1H3TLB5_9PSEU|nr:hypothetical protein [Saccharopolyspora shandongensis]SDZ51082.1 hypothetical protein SAMN05216215_10873 [Saccharopolyspora shandongensis]
MEAITGALFQSLPQFGSAGALLALLAFVMRHAASDRGDYRAALGDAETRHAAELARIAEAHDAELRELRDDVAALRKQLDELHLALDVERSERRRAEDQAAELARRAGGNAP